MGWRKFQGNDTPHGQASVKSRLKDMIGAMLKRCLGSESKFCLECLLSLSLNDVRRAFRCRTHHAFRPITTTVVVDT